MLFGIGVEEFVSPPRSPIVGTLVWYGAWPNTAMGSATPGCQKLAL